MKQPYMNYAPQNMIYNANMQQGSYNSNTNYNNNNFTKQPYSPNRQQTQRPYN